MERNRSLAKACTAVLALFAWLAPLPAQGSPVDASDAVEPLVAHEQSKLTPPDLSPFDHFGGSLAISGESVIVGASGVDQPGAADAGAAYVFERDGTNWTERFTLAASDATMAYSYFGWTMGISGDTVICGAFDDQAGGLHAGAAYTFVLLEGPWISLGDGLPGTAGTPDLSGRGQLAPGSAGVLELSSAAPAAPALLFASLSSTPSPFQCGTLVPAAGDIESLQATDSDGTVLLDWTHWPDGLSGLHLFFQFAVLDAAAECGVALSNALAAEVP